MQVSNMKNNNGNKVPNQFITGTMFQSYESNIAFIPYDSSIIYLGEDWAYSTTTAKYRNLFLGMNKDELVKKINNGEAIIMEDL